MPSKPIYVTKPYLPALEDLYPHLQKIWENKILTNGGPYHQTLEKELENYLKIPSISLFCNGTIALITALQALDIKGEVITTPYSFVATTHALRWNNIEPIFVDIDPLTFNIDPQKIESAITPKTTAILAVHCYGLPCDIHAIEVIAKKHNLKIIYDAAHAFGVTSNEGRSILNYGDLSVLSFHATKVFNTLEGGAIVAQNKDLKIHIDQLKNFGFVDELTVVSAGINGKMNEINAAIGLLQLNSIDQVISKRKVIDKEYRESFEGVNGIKCLNFPLQTNPNYSYFPILIDSQFRLTRDELYDLLKQEGIYSRKYFYPLISDFPMYKNLTSATDDNLPVAKKVSSQVLCLPIYPDLQINEQKKIINLILGY